CWLVSPRTSMAQLPPNTCVSAEIEAEVEAARPSAGSAEAAAKAEPDSANLAQDYSQLRERLVRTTNALASAAHDLKTPLAILNGYVELLQSEKLGGLNPRQREILRDMRSSGQRLQHFIQDFLTYSVLETGELKMHYENGDMNRCLAEV